MSNSYLSEIETGNKVPGLDLLERYAKVFKMPVSSILLFSETIGSKHKASAKLRSASADKILRLLEWLEEHDALKKRA